MLACTGSHALLSLAVVAYPRIDLWADSIEALLALPIPDQGPLLLACTDDLPDGSVLELIMQLRPRLAGRPLLVVAVLDASTDPLRLKALAEEGVQGLCCMAVRLWMPALRPSCANPAIRAAVLAARVA